VASTGAEVALREPFAGRRSGWDVNWRRLGRRAFIAGGLVAAAVQLTYSATGGHYGLDFHGGIWHAGKTILAGESPFPPPLVGMRLLRGPSGFMNPPLLALIGLPFAQLPFWVAVTLFNLLCVAAVLSALHVLEVTDRRIHVLVLCSFPVVSSVALGQPDGLLALAAAAAWRWRDDSWRGAVAGGVLIAAKLLAWPLLIWLLLTRRFRQAAVAAGSAAILVLGPWAAIGFRGLAAYPRLLADDARTYAYVSHSIVSSFMHLGFDGRTAAYLSLCAAVAIVVSVAGISRGSDAGLFTAALAGGVLASPMVWDHYLVLLFICLAAVRRMKDGVAWLLIAALWLCPVENPATLWQALLVPVIATGFVLRVGFLSKQTGHSK